MKKKIFWLGLAILLSFTVAINAQSRRNDIPIKDVPHSVIKVLNEYIAILKSKTLDKCAEKFISVAGGSLVNSRGKQIAHDLKRFSLKKDYNNIKFYADPIEITRVNKSKSNGDGYGQSAIKGTRYKIWIGKKAGVKGMPAPISIMVPEGHKTIKTPKVIGIGSL